MTDPNLWAVLAAALSSFLVGGFWYSPALFGAASNRESGRDPKGETSGHPARVFGVSFLFSLVAAYRALRRMAIRSQQHSLPNDRLVLQADAAPSLPIGAMPFGYCALLALPFSHREKVARSDG